MYAVTEGIHALVLEVSRGMTNRFKPHPQEDNTSSLLVNWKAMLIQDEMKYLVVILESRLYFGYLGNTFPSGT
ncbi:hypothetical protein QLX08_003175 [Tetragonisca angustula]|uniref:Uncharacterized protein n=1 Tax=Tetragonisca angustula TaxID=166442 RepID=A0AAW1A7X1_9HYME